MLALFWYYTQGEVFDSDRLIRSVSYFPLRAVVGAGPRCWPPVLFSVAREFFPSCETDYVVFLLPL